MIFKLWLKACSFDKNSLRRLTLKRFFVVFIIFPIILMHITFCRCCLLLDNLFYKGYKDYKINRLLFIVGVPRSGTSFLLNLIGNNKSNFTTFKLWELVFAPSIIQKKILLNIKGVFNKVGISFDTIIELINNVFFAKMETIHHLDLNEIEEDELVYMYLYKSAYLMFLFPELEELHQLLKPDNSKNIRDRIKQQRFYKSLIKRHLYVFNVKNDKFFLSKNPMHSIRLESLNTVFPNAKYLLIQRELEKTVPSSLSLNFNLYQFFCTVNNENPLRQKTIKMLLDWHKYLHVYTLKTNWKPIKISFKEMVKKPSSVGKSIHSSLSLGINSDYENYLNTQDEFSRNYQSKHNYSLLTKEELNFIIHNTKEIKKA